MQPNGTHCPCISTHAYTNAHTNTRKQTQGPLIIIRRFDCAITYWIRWNIYNFFFFLVFNSCTMSQLFDKLFNSFWIFKLIFFLSSSSALISKFTGLIWFITAFRMIFEIHEFPSTNFWLSCGRNRSKYINAAQYTLYFGIDGLVSIHTGWLKFSFVIWMFTTILNRMLTLILLAAAR